MNSIGTFLSILIPIIYGIPFFLVFKEENYNTLIVILSFLVYLISSFLTFSLFFRLIATIFYKKIDKKDEELRDDAGIYIFLLNKFYLNEDFNKKEFLD
jgi:hypothetical protein